MMAEDVPTAKGNTQWWPSTVQQILRTVELGNTNLNLPATQYVSFSARQEGLFGVKATGQVGDVGSEDRLEAVRVPALDVFEELGGGFGWACGREGTEVRCWGHPWDGTLGEVGEGSSTPLRRGELPVMTAERVGEQ